MNIIKTPLITEKNTFHNAAGIYVFKVDLKASKTDIRQAVEKKFKVKVAGVRTAVCRGHSKQTKFGMTKVAHWKKAFIQLVPGEKIALFEGV